VVLVSLFGESGRTDGVYVERWTQPVQSGLSIIEEAALAV